jgi:hypothetical protein
MEMLTAVRNFILKSQAFKRAPRGFSSGDWKGLMLGAKYTNVA